jgi:hypothetical protein
MRDKLIELLEKAESAVYWDSSDQSFVNKIADFLLANGVTFAEDNNVPRKKPMTNGDRIRSMSDEGLAEFNRFCPFIDEECTMKGCNACILDWLKQETDHDTD